MSTLQQQGKLIVKYDTVQVSEKFKKREFVIELADDINGNTYTNYAKFQCVQAKCDLLDRFNIGDTVNVSFNIKGTHYEKEGKENYFSNLDCWRIEPVGQPASQPTTHSGTWQASDANHPANQPSPENADDLPF